MSSKCSHCGDEVLVPGSDHYVGGRWQCAHKWVESSPRKEMWLGAPVKVFEEVCEKCGERSGAEWWCDVVAPSGSVVRERLRAEREKLMAEQGPLVDEVLRAVEEREQGDAKDRWRMVQEYLDYMRAHAEQGDAEQEKDADAEHRDAEWWRTTCDEVESVREVLQAALGQSSNGGVWLQRKSVERMVRQLGRALEVRDE